VCKYMCPYARFQSAMFDQDTLIISYDERRGEPRGGRSKGADRKQQGLGDCINCTLCVQVCPTGIDIRDGLQYECIACAACIDVCDQVMDKMDYPRGLIRYTTESALKHGNTRVIRPRLVVYGTLLLVLIGGTLWSMTHRMPLRADLIRDRNALYRELPGGMIENVYTMKVTNMDDAPHRYSLSVAGNTVAEIEAGRPLQLAASATDGFTIRIRLPAAEGSGVETLSLELVADEDPAIRTTLDAKVLMPVRPGSPD